MKKLSIEIAAGTKVSKEEIVTMTSPLAIKFFILCTINDKKPAVLKKLTDATKIDLAFQALARDKAHARFVKREYPEIAKKVRKSPAEYKKTMLKYAAWIFSGSFEAACKKAAQFFLNASKAPDTVSDARKQSILKFVLKVEEEFNKV